MSSGTGSLMAAWIVERKDANQIGFSEFNQAHHLPERQGPKKAAESGRRCTCRQACGIASDSLPINGCSWETASEFMSPPTKHDRLIAKGRAHHQLPGHPLSLHTTSSSNPLTAVIKWTNSVEVNGLADGCFCSNWEQVESYSTTRLRIPSLVRVDMVLWFWAGGILAPRKWICVSREVEGVEISSKTPPSSHHQALLQTLTSPELCTLEELRDRTSHFAGSISCVLSQGGRDYSGSKDSVVQDCEHA